MRYAVVGVGAVGGFYGALLHQAGHEVHFLLNRDYAWVKEKGLRLETNGQTLHLQVPAYDAATAMPPCDVVLVALKTTQNHLLAEILPPLLKPDGVVVLLQNGLGMEENVAEFLEAGRVLGGICFLCAHKVGPGHIQHLDHGSLTLGALAPDLATRPLQHLATALQGAGVPVVLAPHLAQARWHKLLWNIPFNGLSVVLNADTAHMSQDPAMYALMEALMYEVLALAAACGCTLDPAAIPQLLKATAIPYLTSMRLDYDARRPLELETMFAQPLKRGEQQGQSAPRITMLYQQLLFLDTRNRADTESNRFASDFVN